MEKLYDVFISYRRDNGQDIARALQLGLENKGLRVFFDLEEIRGGKFNEKLYDSIEQSKNMIFLLTEGACDRCVNEGDWVRLELEHALQKQINIVPVAPLGCPRAFPETLPESLEPMRTLNIAVLDKNDLFKQTVQEIISNYLTDVELTQDAEKQEAEKVFLELARGYKGNDGFIDTAERADLEAKAREFKITAVRREALIQQVEHEFQSTGGLSAAASAAQAQYDVFISYRRDGGAAYARLMYDRLTQAGYSVSFDMDTLKNGNFNEELLRRVAGCRNFIVLLSKDCFRRTLEGGKRENDWLRIELATALVNKKNIVSVMLPGFVFPDMLPPDIDAIRYKNGPKYDDYYLDDFYKKLITDFLEGKDARTEPAENAQGSPGYELEWKKDVSVDESLEELLGDDAEYCRAEAESIYRSIFRIIPYPELKRIDDAWFSAEYNMKQGDHKIASKFYMDVLNFSSRIKPSALPFVTRLTSDGIDPRSENWFEQAIQKARDGNADYQYGIGLLYSSGIGVEKDPSAAFRWFEYAADQGHNGAIAAVGAAYASGNGIEKNYSLAFRYLEKALGAGDASAAERLGFLYRQGFGLPQKDYGKAVQYYRNAAESGNADAMFALGEMIENGQGGTPDLQQAIFWYRAAAGKGNPAAQVKMAQFLFFGKGIVQNLSEALKFARAAADSGSADAAALLGKAYEDGLGVPADKEKAEELYRAASERGSELAKTYLAGLEAEVQYHNGVKCLEGELGLERDYKQARFWFEKSAAQGNAAAMEQLGYLCERGLGGEFDIQTAKLWYEKAAEGGNAAAMADLGSLYYTGDSGIEKDYPKAMTLLKRAASMLNSTEKDSQWKVLNAFFCIGKMFEDGLGVEKNMTLALRFYLNGAHHGNLRCAFQLAQIYRMGRPGISPSPENSKRWFEFCATYENKLCPEDDRALRIIGHLYYMGVGGRPEDFEVANLWYERSAKMGNIYALDDVGQAYLEGEGAPKNIDVALEYFTAAAERGYVFSQNRVSWIYYKGLGNTKKDFQKACYWGLKAAENGSSGAMATLFRMYRDGEGVEQDSAKALEWLRKAAEKGNTDAVAALGHCFETGELGVEKDPCRAVEYYKRAASRKNTRGLYELGRCCKEGIGIEKNTALALKYLVDAVQKKDDDLFYDLKALDLLDEMYFANDDFASNVALFDKLDMQSNKIALFRLGKRYHNGKPQNTDRVLLYYTAAAERGNEKAQNNLGWMYYQGTAVERDYEKAFEWTMRAVKGGCAAGMETLFRMYRDGTGVKQDNKEAIAWLQRASDITQEEAASFAMSEMGECYEYGLLDIEKDEQKAFSLYAAGARKSACPAKYNLGRCFLRGIGTAKNVRTGILYLTEAAELEDVDDDDCIYQERAMRLLAEVYGTDEYGTKSEEKAREWLMKAEALKERSSAK